MALLISSGLASSEAQLVIQDVKSTTLRLLLEGHMDETEAMPCGCTCDCDNTVTGVDREAENTAMGVDSENHRPLCGDCESGNHA